MTIVALSLRERHSCARPAIWLSVHANLNLLTAQMKRDSSEVLFHLRMLRARIISAAPSTTPPAPQPAICDAAGTEEDRAGAGEHKCNAEGSRHLDDMDVGAVVDGDKFLPTIGNADACHESGQTSPGQLVTPRSSRVSGGVLRLVIGQQQSYITFAEGRGRGSLLTTITQNMSHRHQEIAANMYQTLLADGEIGKLRALLLRESVLRAFT